MRRDVSNLYFNINQNTKTKVHTFQDREGYLWNQVKGGKRVFYTDCSERQNCVDSGFYIGVYDGVEGSAEKVDVENNQEGETKALKIVIEDNNSKNNKKRGIEIRTDCKEAIKMFDDERSARNRWSKIEVTWIKGHLENRDPKAKDNRADKGNQMAHSWAKHGKDAEQYGKTIPCLSFKLQIKLIDTKFRLLIVTCSSLHNDLLATQTDF